MGHTDIRWDNTPIPFNMRAQLQTDHMHVATPTCALYYMYTINVCLGYGHHTHHIVNRKVDAKQCWHIWSYISLCDVLSIIYRHLWFRPGFTFDPSTPWDQRCECFSCEPWAMATCGTILLFYTILQIRVSFVSHHVNHNYTEGSRQFSIK